MRSSVLTEGHREILVLFQLRGSDRGLRSFEGADEVLLRDRADIELTLILKIQPIPILSRLPFPTWRPFTIGQFPKLLCQLKPSDRLVDCVSDEDVDIAA